MKVKRRIGMNSCHFGHLMGVMVAKTLSFVRSGA